MQIVVGEVEEIMETLSIAKLYEIVKAICILNNPQSAVP